MKILLDECVPVQVRNALSGHDVTSVQRMGWSGLSNGELLSLAEDAGFELFVVADKTSVISKTSQIDESRFWNSGPIIGPHWNNTSQEFARPQKA